MSLFHFAAIVLNFVNEQNRPVNAQNVADALQKFNLKKAAIQKALDILADGKRISFKEFGKQKIYLARQDQFQIPNTEELNHMKKQNADLQKQLEDQKKATSEVEAEIKSLQSNLTLEQIFEREVNLRLEVQEMEDKLTKLRGGVTLVKPEERKAVENMLSEMIGQWRKRKRMFKDLWDTLTENSPKDPKEFQVSFLACHNHRSYLVIFNVSVIILTLVCTLQEELGIEYDEEDVGVSLQSYNDLIQQGQKRPRGQ
ncbi:hypothetical protein AAZV13_01G067300 [Glycine max]